MNNNINNVSTGNQMNVNAYNLGVQQAPVFPQPKKSNKGFVFLILVVQIAVIGLIIFLVFSLFGKKKLTADEQEAAEKAVAHLEEKYGINAEIVSASRYKICYGVGPCDETDNYNVTLKEGKKKILVFIGDNGIADNYQKDLIIEGIDDYVYKLIGSKPKEREFCFGVAEGGKCEGLVYEYYDGNNLEELFSDYLNSFRMKYEYISLSNLDAIRNNKLFQKLDGYAFFINYKSSNSFNKTKDHDYNFRGSYLEEKFENNSSNLKDVATYAFEEEYYYDYMNR